MRYLPAAGVAAIFYRLWSAVGCFPCSILSGFAHHIFPPQGFQASFMLVGTYICTYLREAFTYSSMLHCRCIFIGVGNTFSEPDWETKVLPCLTFRAHILLNLIAESIVRAYFSFFNYYIRPSCALYYLRPYFAYVTPLFDLFL